MELVHDQDKNQEYRKAARKLVAQMDLREKCSPATAFVKIPQRRFLAMKFRSVVSSTN